jgi:hypothetical protein
LAHEVPPVLKDTLPSVTAVAGLPLVTVAVNVTDAPFGEGFCEEVTAVDVIALTTWTTVPSLVANPEAPP